MRLPVHPTFIMPLYSNNNNKSSGNSSNVKYICVGMGNQIRVYTHMLEYIRTFMSIG